MSDILFCHVHVNARICFSTSICNFLFGSMVFSSIYMLMIHPLELTITENFDTQFKVSNYANAKRGKNTIIIG